MTGSGLLAALLAVAFSCSTRAQTIEGQPIAAQFGQYHVSDEGNGFSFSLNQCNVLGAGQNFPAFTTGVPVKVVDPQPGFTEVSTNVTAFVSASTCAVSLGGLTHPHLASFYLTSGTGGLQEALNNSRLPPGITNNIILNSSWYQLIAPRTAASVIGSVTGSTAFGLVDVTTIPYTNYSWNGSQYVAVATSGGGGATFPNTGGLVFSTSATSSRVATGADVANALSGQAIAPSSLAISGLSGQSQCLATDAHGNVSGTPCTCTQAQGVGIFQPWCYTNSGNASSLITQADAAFNAAVAFEQAGSNGATVDLGAQVWPVCNQTQGWILPHASNAAGVSIAGSSEVGSGLTTACSIARIALPAGSQAGSPISNAMIWEPVPATTQLTHYHMHDFTMHAGGASACMDMEGTTYISKFENIGCVGAIGDGSPTANGIRFGNSNYPTQSWSFQVFLENLSTVYSGTPGSGATFAVAAGSGSPSVSVTAGGSGYSANTIVFLNGIGAVTQPCTTMGALTPVFTGGAISSVTASGFSGCSGTLYAQAYDPVQALKYGIYLDMWTDSTARDLQPQIGTLAALYVAHGDNHLEKTHPCCGMPVGIIDAGKNSWTATEFDSLGSFGMKFAGTSQSTLNNSQFFWNANYPGAGGYFFGSSVGPVTLIGGKCNGLQSAGGYNQVVSPGGIGVLPSGAALINEQECVNGNIQNSLTQQKNSLNITAAGDSLTIGNEDNTGGNYPSDLQVGTLRNVRNFGVGGQTSAQILSRLQNAAYVYDDWVSIWAGRNDPSSSISPAQTLANIQSMISLLPAATTRVNVMTIMNDEAEPSGSSAYTDLAARNALILGAYPGNTIDIRSQLVAAYNPANPVDVHDHASDIPPYTLRAVVATGALGVAISTTATCSITLPGNTTLAGFDILAVDSEYILATAISGSSITACTRGYAGSTAATHAAGASFTVTDYLHLGYNGYQIVANAVSSFIAAHDARAGAVSQNFSTDAYGNTFTGSGALANTQLGASNDTAFGVLSCLSNTSGNANTCFGSNALMANATGNGNTGVGSYAFKKFTGSFGTAYGSGAGGNATTAAFPTVTGYQAGGNNATGNYLTACGAFALLSSNADDNTGCGYQAGQNISTGIRNALFGSKAAPNATGSTGLAAFGWSAGSGCTTCTYSGAFGGGAGLGAAVTGAFQVGQGTNSTSNTLQFQGWNFLDNAGDGNFLTVKGFLFSASGTALPSCGTLTQGVDAKVSDAASPTYMGVYVSGGGITADVVCSFNGGTYQWLTH